MIVCLDTNTVVQALAEGHSYHPILNAWISGQFIWAVSTEVLLEYEEVLTRMSGAGRWRKLARLMDLAELTSNNLRPDDNIFTDCAVTAGADFLITEDRDFDVLRGAGYKPQPITPLDFIVRILPTIQATKQ